MGCHDRSDREQDQPAELTAGERAELHRLRREAAELRTEVAIQRKILRKAAAWFAQEMEAGRSHPSPQPGMLGYRSACAVIGIPQFRCKETIVSITMICAKVKEEHVADVEQAAKRLFDAIEREQLQGVRYASTKLADGVTFVIFLQLQNPDNNPMAPLPEFKDFQEGLKGYLAGPPSPEQLTVVGSYRLFDK